MTDDLPFDYPSAANPGAAPAKVCRRHAWLAGTVFTTTDGVYLDVLAKCLRCGKVRDDVLVRRGRTNRSRGNSIERDIGKQLGLRRVGQFGGPDDLSGEMFAAQVKSGGAFSERWWSWLRAVPVNAGQTPLLVVTDAPGPGHRRRAVVVIEIGDWIALHGPTEVEG